MSELRHRASASDRGGAVARALGGGLVMAVALGVGTGLGPALADACGVGGLPARLIPAALVSAVAVPLILRAARPGSLGFGNAGLRLHAFLIGVGVTVAAAALVLGAGTAAGMLDWARPDPAALVGFVLSNALVALLLEALPEETTLRGYAWTSLRERFGAMVSALGTTAAFLLVPGVSTVVEAGVARLVGEEPPPIGPAPAGQHPVDYLVLLTVFGLMLVAARTAVAGAPLWATIGAHLTFLTVNRVVLEGNERDAGWSVDQTTPDAVLLVPTYLLVATVAFLAYGRIARRGSPGGRLHTGRTRRTG
ncbi:CPBP family glutamic-type intramembrane protease [Streptomyces botrytidirepellens]|uniref:CPBP family glutamic-type intramembrane protease n=1 Tax=Streptomyces botrytidirepellens TaxID=2486417 RepID=UPI00160FC319|nr:CPBP family glutamic-type intramembrane protease [Streptomyces botrytidirepellens]